MIRDSYDQLRINHKAHSKPTWAWMPSKLTSTSRWKAEASWLSSFSISSVALDDDKPEDMKRGDVNSSNWSPSRLDLVPPPSPAVIASGCPVSYRTPLINSLLQRLSLFASKFQRQGPLNVPELALYPMACQLTTTSMAQWPLCRPQPSSELSTTSSWRHPSQKTR